MKKTIAIVAGGNSSEYGVSVKSAAAVARSVKDKYRTFIITIKGLSWYWEDNSGMALPVNKNDFTLQLHDEKVRFDAVFIAIHGTPGENGLLQGYFDMLRIPYTGCDAFCSALTFDKHACKIFLASYGIKMARSIRLGRNDKIDIEQILSETGIPCFVKPNTSGSSFGVTMVTAREQMQGAIESAFSESNHVLVETYLKGTEVGCGVMKCSKGDYVLPVTEIVSKNTFFDFEAKYTPGKADEITPARISDEMTERIRSLSSEIYDILGCRGVVRVDFIIVDNEPVFLEINSIPGMTEESIIPKQLDAFGINPSEFYSLIIEDLF